MQEQDLSEAGLGICRSALLLLSSGLTERFTSCSLGVLTSVLSFPGAVPLSGDLHAALSLWACIFLAVLPGFDPLQGFSFSLR